MSEKTTSKKKRTLTGVGLAAGLVAGGGAGFLMEMSGSAGASSASATTTAATTPTDPSAPVTPAAGSTTDPVKPDRTAQLKETLQSLIDDGTLTQAQVDAVIAKFEAAMPAGGIGGPGGERGGPGGERGGRFGGGNLDVVATTLGITADEVRTAVQGGQTIAQLAVAKGKTAQDVIDALVADAKTKLDAKVTAGDLTQAEADTRLADETTRITDFVNNATPAKDGGPGFGGHGPRKRGDRPADAPATPAPAAPTPATSDTTPATTPA